MSAMYAFSCIWLKWTLSLYSIIGHYIVVTIHCGQMAFDSLDKTWPNKSFYLWTGWALERNRWRLSPKTPFAILANEWCLQTHGFNITANCFFAVNVLFSSSCGIFVSYGHVSSEWDRLRMKTRLFSSILLLFIQLYSVFIFCFCFGHAIPINIFKNGCHLDYILCLFGQRSLITSHDFKI